MPLISIIIPLYNKEKFITNTLESIFAQTFSDFEVLVIDDGSTDESARMANEFDDKRVFFISKGNEGVSATRNLGIEKASGKYIAFLDADDFWFPNFLENMVSMIAQFPNEKVFSSAIEVQIGKQIFEANYSISKGEKVQIINFFKGSLSQTAIFTSSAIFEKSVFENSGNFDVSLKTDEDIDLWIRIGLKYPIVFSWKIGARYNFDSYGLSKNNKLISEKTDFHKYFEIEEKNPDLRKYLSIHRFSMAIKSKIANQQNDFERFYKLTNLDDLNSKQRILISLPSFFLQILFKLKLFLEQKNIQISVFK